MPFEIINKSTGKSVIVGSQIGVNARKRPVYIGPRGGKYIIGKKSKRYGYPGKEFKLLPKHTKTTVGFNHKRRPIHLGERGGTYVIYKGRKLYGYPGRGAVTITYPVSPSLKSRMRYVTPGKTRGSVLKAYIRG